MTESMKKICENPKIIEFGSLKEVLSDPRGEVDLGKFLLNLSMVRDDIGHG
jgi:hypothetical protein